MTDLDSVLAEIVKKWGEGTVRMLEDVADRQYESISSGCLAIDLATGIGGYPRGAITTLYGPDQAGKTTMCLWFLACLRQTGGTGVFVDMEHKTPDSYIGNVFRSAGAEFDFPILRLDTGNDALEAVEKLIGQVDAIVIDSIPALIPGAELDADYGSSTMGMQARLISQSMRRVGRLLDLSRTALVFTNQVRANLAPYGGSETRPGGKYLSHQELLRMRIRQVGRDAQGNIECEVSIRKNQATGLLGKAEFRIVRGVGLDIVKDTFEGAKGVVIEQAGSYYKYGWDGTGEVTSIHGEAAVLERLGSDLDLVHKIRAEAREAIQAQFQSGNTD